jgi:16S rRNA (guanine527-N7)-methyltransferase
MEIAQLKLALSQLGIAFNDDQLKTLDQFAAMVNRTNQSFNLTAHETIEMIREKGIYDSLCFPLTQWKGKGRLLDLGSGAGFPGIPLNIIYPQFSITLLEPTLKKAAFLTEVIAAFQLKKINVISQRAEVLARSEDFKPFDLVVARAVAPLPILLELMIPLLKVGGQALVYKGKDYLSEIALSKHALSVLGASIVEVKTHRLPTEHEQRSLLIIEKNSETSTVYPRMFSQIKKTPL